MTTNTYSTTLPAGQYSASMSAFNDNGTAHAGWIRFEVVDNSKIVIGDCNNDGQFSISDILMLQKWLLNDETELTNWQSADLDENGMIDVFDLCLMKQELINK